MQTVVLQLQQLLSHNQQHSLQLLHLRLCFVTVEQLDLQLLLQQVVWVLTRTIGRLRVEQVLLQLDSVLLLTR
jgi:hypothetical protein